jgi:hypothetical protein
MIIGGLNLTDFTANKKGPENQVPFYLVRLGEASVVRKASLCASRTPAGYACGPGENFLFLEHPLQLLRPSHGRLSR